MDFEDDDYDEDEDEEGDGLNIATYMSGSCACLGISGLMQCAGPEDALAQFCAHELGAAGRYGETASGTLGAHYVFVAGPEVLGHGWSSKGWTKYGTEFAAFLKEKGLGHVAASTQVLNKRYHPDTTCQVWIFTPDEKAVKEWWAEYQKPKKPVEKPVEVKTPPVKVAPAAAMKAVAAKLKKPVRKVVW